MTDTTKKKNHKIDPSKPASTFYLSHSAVIAISLFIAAFFVRFLYLVQIRSTLSFAHPIMDSLYYINMAKEIAAGTFQPERAFFMGPLYPYFLALVIKLIGFGWMKIRLIQIIIGSLSVVLVYQIARRCFHEEKIALPATIISIFWGVFIYYDTNLLMGFLVVFLNLFLLWSLIGLLKTPSPLRFFLSGVAAGLSALCRANIFLFVPFCIFWLYEIFRRQFPAGMLSKRIALFLLGIALLVLPVTARNYLIEKDWVPLTSNGGLNFYIGNNPYSKGIYIPLNLLKLPYQPTPSATAHDRMDLQAKKIAEKIEGRELKSSEISTFWFSQAIEFLRREPGKFFYNLATKLALCWTGKEIPQIENYYFSRERFSVLGIPLLNFGIFAPLALWGVVLGFKDKKQEVRLLIYYLLAMTLAVSLFFVTSRYRTPLVPVVLIMAVFGVSDLIRRLHWKDWIGTAKGVLGVGVFALLVNQPMIHNDFAANHYNRGTIYYQLGEWDKAMEEFSACLVIRPDYTDAYHARGIIYRRQGLFPQALAEFKKILQLRPDYTDAQVNIAIVYLEQNRPKEARHELEQLLKKGEIPLGLVTMGKLLLTEGRTKEAKATLSRAIRLWPEVPDAHALLGEIFAAESRFDLAANKFQTAITLAGENADASLYYKLGVSYHLIKRLEHAEVALKQAMAKDPTLTETHIALGNLFFDLNRFTEAVEQFEIAYRQYPDISNQYNLANAYAEAGYDKKAVETYEKLLLNQADHKRAWNNLGNVFLNKKEYEKAIACYEKSLKVDPQFATPLHNLGDIYNERKDSSRALNYYQQSLALEQDPQRKTLLLYRNLNLR
jgi:tetratricopeptide (TPR) repeat protein